MWGIDGRLCAQAYTHPFCSECGAALRKRYAERGGGTRRLETLETIMAWLEREIAYPGAAIQIVRDEDGIVDIEETASLCVSGSNMADGPTVEIALCNAAAHAATGGILRTRGVTDA